MPMQLITTLGLMVSKTDIFGKAPASTPPIIAVASDLEYIGLNHCCVR